MPVNPVCPYTEAGASGQVGLASGLLVLGLSNPNPLRLFSLLALVKLETVWAEMYLSPPYSPWLRYICKSLAKSLALENKPAFPLTPPEKAANSSCG